MTPLTSAQPWFLRRFLVGIGVFLGLQVVLIAAGVPWVLDLYQKSQADVLTREALAVILDHRHAVIPEVLEAGPFLVFDVQGNLLFTNRGQGRTLDPKSFTSVVWEGSVVGRVYVGETAFLTRTANQRFLATLGALFCASGLGSLVVGLLWARFNSRHLTKLFAQLEADISNLDQRPPSVRPAPFLELAAISRGLEGLGHRLSDSERQQKAFLQDVAHDLRTPLAGLRSQLEALADGLLSPDPDRFRKMLVETDRTVQMINDLSLLFRTETFAPLQREEFSWSDLVRDLEFRYETTVRGRGILWQDETPPLTFAADRTLMLRAVGNLVENALQHAVGLTSLRFGGLSGPELTLWVENDGSPVSNEVVQRMFDRHWRGDPGRGEPGSGLGLSIVQSIVARHGGSVRALQLPEGGLRIELAFPSP